MPSQSAETLPTINTQLIAEIDSSIIVKLDGATLNTTEVHRTLDGNLYVNAMPIFQHLGNDVEYDDVSKALIVRRSQDGVVMELYTDTGVVKADGRALGKLKHFGEITPEQFILTPNAIAVLAGAAGKFDAESNEFRFKLDPRLKVATGFDIFVEGIPLGAVSPEPKSVGPVLLLPLVPIAEALGDDIDITDGGEVVSVRRAQDSVVMSLNLSTGLVSARGKPVGLAKDIAYIDQTNLLLPVSAIEALTGTHIKAEAGTDRINIDLDDRLSGAITPRENVDDATKDDPFTPESLQFQISPDTGARVQFDAYAGRVNGRLRYELQDLPSNERELRPSWLSLDFAHTNGLTGSLGDYSASFRELDPVGERRIVGVAAQKTTDKGRWALAAGVPQSGVEVISSDQTRPSYSGFAVGVRYADKEGWEAGLAVARDNITDDQRAVLQAISGRLGRKENKPFQWTASASLGIFDGPARESSVDLRLDGDVRRQLNENVSVDARASYVGAEFLNTALNQEAQQDRINDILNPDAVDDALETPPDIRRRGSDEAEVTLSARYVPRGDTGFFSNPAGSASVQYRQTGVLKSGAQTADLKSASIGGSSGFGDSNINVSVNASMFEVNTSNRTVSGREDNKVTGTQFGVQAYKQIHDFTLRAQYNRNDQSDRVVGESAVLSINRNAFAVPLPKEAILNIAPSFAGVWDGDNVRGRAGVNANFDSGDMFGRKNVVKASFGILQSVSTRGSAESNKFLSVSAARRLPIGKNMSLGLGYRNDLRGDHRLGLQLDGNFNFNPARNVKKTQDGRGILTGQVFLDRNRDGIRQSTEPGIPRTIVRVKGTSLALRSGADGHFTVQNIKEGLFEVQIEAKSLPIGYDLSEDVLTRVTIGEGQITHIDMPVVQRGQIRGFAFEDDNGNGTYDKGETRVEGAKLRVVSKDGDIEDTIYTTSFGQYAFDDLAVGEYDIEVMPMAASKIAGGAVFSVTLDPELDLMARQNIIIKRGDPIKDVQQKPTGARSGTVIIEDIPTPWDLAQLRKARERQGFTSGSPPDEISSGAAPP